jgi:glycosyltransferase involved in cell wall biosynthesis
MLYPVKLIIQIPCYNEAQTLKIALDALPRKVEGFDKVEWLLIDDGSTDNSVEIARQCGVDHVISFTKNQGLAKVFMAGIEQAIFQGADVIVNTDADNQYNADDIPLLTAPILSGKADIVIGERPIRDIRHFSWIKKQLQKLGSWVVRKASGTDIPDAPSGFRAMSRDAAMRLNVFNDYTYTLETIIQAGLKNMAILSVPIRVNEDLRPSRLIKSIPRYIRISILTIFRIFITYKPFEFFFLLGGFSFLGGFALGVRWLVFFLMGSERTRVPSLILTAILVLIGIFFIFLGVLADLISVNRKIAEENQYRLRRLESNFNNEARPGKGAEK